MTTCAVVGTCLANITSVFLMHEYRWQRLNNASGVRSDHYLEYFIERTGQMPPKEKLLAMVEFNPKTEAELRQRIDENYIDTCGRFKMTEPGPGLIENIETTPIEVFLLDNLYDIERPSLIYKPRAGEASFSLDVPLAHFANASELRQRFSWSDHLTGRESAVNWARIVEYIKKWQPKAKLFFLCGHYCTSLDHPDRYRRAVEFYETFKELGGALDVHVVPPLDLEPELMKSPDDFFHYDMSVYKALAGYIQSILVANWPMVRSDERLPDRVLSFAGLNGNADPGRAGSASLDGRSSA